MDAITVEHSRRTRRGVVAGAAAGLAGLGLGFLRPSPADAATFNEPVSADSFHLNNGSVDVVPTLIDSQPGSHVRLNNGSVVVLPDRNGSIELGKNPSSEAQAPFIDFHWAGGSGNSQDYNARIQNFLNRQLNIQFDGGAYTQFINGGIVARPDLAQANPLPVSPLAWTGTMPSNSPAALGWSAIAMNCNYQRDTADGYHIGYQGIYSGIRYGTGTDVAKGITHGITSQTIVEGCNDDHSEQGSIVVFHRYDNTAATNPTLNNGGRAWLMDLNMHGAINVQQGLLNGIVMFMNNHTAVSPSLAESASMWLMTRPGTGGGIDLNNPQGHRHQPTHPIDNAIAIVGGAGSSGTLGQETVRQGFKVGIRVGGGNEATGAGSGATSGGPWGAKGSHFGKGMLIRDYETHGIHLTARWSGTAQAIRVEPDAGGIFALGGLVIKTRTTPPTSSPVEPDLGPGQVVFNTTNNRLYIRSTGGVWRSAAFQ